ncbi:hypothetical protein [Flavobacterium phage FLiP]|uniref:Uncharacterized protein n=1 Tax=Flavobacterium phage FLiP TaxID=2023716 RepID=A0A222NP96_9VIRU|nr:hypothetical protein HOR88_gp03 [Flavobacterium phage FLiP]ASQ41221.1 hypothetical protein [Flavobacterium phage FLiP]
MFFVLAFAFYESFYLSQISFIWILMYILKTPANVVYCTSNKELRRSFPLGYPVVCPLGLVVDIPIYDFIVSVFEEKTNQDHNHILTHFDMSQYFVVNFKL